MSIELHLPRHKTLSEQVEILLDGILDQDREEALEILEDLYSKSKKAKERRALRAFILALLALGPVEVVIPEPESTIEPEIIPEPEPEPIPEPEPEPEPAPKPKKKKKEMSMMSLDLSDAAMMLQFGGGADEPEDEPVEDEPSFAASVADFDTVAMVEDVAETLEVETSVENPDFNALPDPIELDPAEAKFIDQEEEPWDPFGEAPTEDAADGFRAGTDLSDLSEDLPLDTQTDQAPLEELTEIAELDQGEAAHEEAAESSATAPKKQKKAATPLEDSSALFAALGPGFSDE